MDDFFNGQNKPDDNNFSMPIDLERIWENERAMHLFLENKRLKEEIAVLKRDAPVVIHTPDGTIKIAVANAKKVRRIFLYDASLESHDGEYFYPKSVNMYEQDDIDDAIKAIEGYGDSDA